MTSEQGNSKIKNSVYILLILLTLGSAGFWIFKSYSLSSSDSDSFLGFSKVFDFKAGMDLITGKKPIEEKAEEPIDLSIFDNQKFKRMQPTAVKLKEFKLGKQNPFDSSSSAGLDKKTEEDKSKSFIDIKEEDFFSF